jgi:hypothetical protein
MRKLSERDIGGNCDIDGNSGVRISAAAKAMKAGSLW